MTEAEDRLWCLQQGGRPLQRGRRNESPSSSPLLKTTVPLQLTPCQDSPHTNGSDHTSLPVLSFYRAHLGAKVKIHITPTISSPKIGPSPPPRNASRSIVEPAVRSTMMSGPNRNINVTFHPRRKQQKEVVTKQEVLYLIAFINNITN